MNEIAGWLRPDTDGNIMILKPDVLPLILTPTFLSIAFTVFAC